MFSLLLLIGICVGYYYLNEYYPREDKEKIYFGIGIFVMVIIIYFMNFQRELMYKIFKQVHDIQKKPLYDISDFMKKDGNEDTNDFNRLLLQNQDSRCARCSNYILPHDSKYASLHYRIPLNQGGSNDHTNLMVICPSCNTPFY